MRREYLQSDEEVAKAEYGSTGAPNDRTKMPERNRGSQEEAERLAADLLWREEPAIAELLFWVQEHLDPALVAEPGEWLEAGGNN